MRNIRSMCDRWPVHHAELSRVRMRTNTSHHHDSVRVVGYTEVNLEVAVQKRGSRRSAIMSPKRTSRDLGSIEELLSRAREPWWKSRRTLWTFCEFPSIRVRNRPCPNSP